MLNRIKQNISRWVKWYENGHVSKETLLNHADDLHELLFKNRHDDLITKEEYEECMLEVIGLEEYCMN